MSKPPFLLVLALCSSACIAAPYGEVRDQAGTLLGTMMAATKRSESFTVVTSRGFVVFVNGYTGEIDAPEDSGGMVFLRPDCTGQPYALGLTVLPTVFHSGWDANGDSRVMYVNRDAEPIEVPAGGSFYQWVRLGDDQTLTCYEQQLFPGWGTERLLPASPNDPDVTGIGNGPFLPPYKVTWTGVHADGFEEAA